MTEAKLTHDVVVHKANIALATGESIGRYTQALNEAGRKHVLQKLNMTQKGGYVYMVEAFSESAIFEVYKNATSDAEVSSYTFFAAPYKRKEGNFTFGELVEVERVTSFKRKASMDFGVAKARSENPEKELFVGWRRSTKAFWSGVL
jgi:hypothetical protein